MIICFNREIKSYPLYLASLFHTKIVQNKMGRDKNPRYVIKYLPPRITDSLQNLLFPLRLNNENTENFPLLRASHGAAPASATNNWKNERPKYECGKPAPYISYKHVILLHKKRSVTNPKLTPQEEHWAQSKKKRTKTKIAK